MFFRILFMFGSFFVVFFRVECFVCFLLVLTQSLGPLGLNLDAFGEHLGVMLVTFVGYGGFLKALVLL